MYIGVLLVLVCILLLSVHCCVRRNVKERKRALRMNLMDSSRRVVHPSGGFTSVPVQDFVADSEYRNSYAETNLNDMDIMDKPRTLLNVIPNPSYPYQIRQSSSSRSSCSKVPTFDRRMHTLEADRQCEWSRNVHPSNIHRSFR